MCRVVDFKGVGHFEDFRLKGYVSRQYGPLDGGMVTTLPLEVFTHNTL